MSTLAGSIQGYRDDFGAFALLRAPIGITVEAIGTLFVTESSKHRIRKITRARNVTTLAGSGTAGLSNGTGANSMFNFVTGVSIHPSGILLVTDSRNNLIRNISIG